MILTIDVASPVPPYEQIRAQIRRMIAHGTLRPGDRLPTIAQLANDLSIAPGTVARAYRELEGDGLVESSRRRGTFVADAASRAPAQANRADVEQVVADFVLKVRQLGIDPDKALARADTLLRKKR